MSEREQLEHEKQVLDETLHAVQNKIKVLQEEKEYYKDKGLKTRAEFWDSITDMDDVEKALNRTIYNETVDDYMVVFKCYEATKKC